jgi:hypothetical protein
MKTAKRTAEPNTKGQEKDDGGEVPAKKSKPSPNTDSDGKTEPSLSSSFSSTSNADDDSNDPRAYDFSWLINRAVAFDNADVDKPGFSTHGNFAKLTSEMIASVATDDERLTEWLCADIKVRESDVGGKGPLKVVSVHGKLVVYFSGKKCVKKDRIMIEKMVKEARKTDDDNEAFAYVVLAPNAGICKRNTLKELVAAAFIVQRATGKELDETPKLGE